MRNMLNKIIKDLDILYKMDYLSEEEEYQDNYKKKSVLTNFLIDSFQRKEKKELTEFEYNEILEKSLEAFSRNTGCGEDLEILETLFEELVELKIISTSRYQKVIESSPVNRWL